MLPSHSHVSLRVTPPLVPPNTTTIPRSLSYAIAWSRRVLGELGGANCVQVPAAPFQSQVWECRCLPRRAMFCFAPRRIPGVQLVQGDLSRSAVSNFLPHRRIP